jgi:hypothetical protein
MIAGSPSLEMQLAVSPVKHLLLVGEHKSVYTDPSKYRKVRERSSLGLGTYFSLRNDFCIEAVHMTRQYSKYSGHFDQVISNGAGNFFTTASGHMNYHQTRLSVYQKYREGFVGITLNYINVLYQIQGGGIPQVAVFYIRDEPYQAHALSINPFYNVKIAGSLNMFFCGAITMTKTIEESGGHMFTPISMRVGFNILLDRKRKNSSDSNSFSSKSNQIGD